MNVVIWWDGDRHGGSVWLRDDNQAQAIAKAMPKDGWNVAWFEASVLYGFHPFPGYEQACAEYLNLGRD